MNKPSVQVIINTLSRLSDAADESAVAYWVSPNQILTLSGARAMCDQVIYGEPSQLEKWRHEANEALKHLSKITDLLASDVHISTNVAGEKYLGYDIVTADGQRYSLSQTQLISSSLVNELADSDISTEEFIQQLKIELKKHPKLKNHSDKDLDHVITGIQLGYPDAAILSALDVWNKNDPFMAPLIDADIRGANYYICPEPVYSYPRSLTTNKQIQRHEQLWSTILKGFYTSEFHQQLTASGEFMEKARELELLRFDEWYDFSNE